LTIFSIERASEAVVDEQRGSGKSKLISGMIV